MADIVNVCTRAPMRAFGGRPLTAIADPRRASPGALARFAQLAGASLTTSSYLERRESIRILDVAGDTRAHGFRACDGSSSRVSSVAQPHRRVDVGEECLRARSRRESPSKSRRRTMSPDSDNEAANLTVLTNEQFHKLLEAVGGRGLIPSLHKLTDEQKKAEKAFNLAGSQMGLGTFVKLPERVTRTDRFLAAPVPRHAAQARMFLQTGVIQAQ